MCYSAHKLRDRTDQHTVSVHKSKLLRVVNARPRVTRMRVLHMVELEHVCCFERPRDTHLEGKNWSRGIWRREQRDARERSWQLEMSSEAQYPCRDNADHEIWDLPDRSSAFTISTPLIQSRRSAPRHRHQPARIHISIPLCGIQCSEPITSASSIDLFLSTTANLTPVMALTIAVAVELVQRRPVANHSL